MASHFGTLSNGQDIERHTLRSGALSVAVLTYGAIVQEVRLDGVGHGLTIGSDRLSDYEDTMGYYGALVGPVANRIAQARCSLDGQILDLRANPGSPHILHSGVTGLHRAVWSVVNVQPDAIALAVELPDGLGGFPGNRWIEVRYELTDEAIFRMRIRAESDQATLINIAGHSYWNLDGGADFTGHQLQIHSDQIVEIDGDGIPTGTRLDVAGTGYDLRGGKHMIPDEMPFDHNYCLSESRVALRPVARLTGASGLNMELATTEPGLQVYDARDSDLSGFAPFAGLALEAQGWPDAPNHVEFPSIRLGAGERYEQITEYRFSRS